MLCSTFFLQSDSTVFIIYLIAVVGALIKWIIVYPFLKMDNTQSRQPEWKIAPPPIPADLATRCIGGEKRRYSNTFEYIA